MIETDNLVIGGGILGLAAAYYLAKRGAGVVLVDKGPFASQSTAGTTGGLTLQNRKPSWYPYYREAATYWSTLGDELGADLDYTECGSLVVAGTQEEFVRQKAIVRRMRAMGLEVTMLTIAEAQEIAPWLSSDLAGASYCPTDSYADPQTPPKAFATAAERHGATLLPNCPVTGLSREENGSFLATTTDGGIRARQVINAAGAWAGKVAAMLDVSLPISLHPLQAFATESMERWLNTMVMHAGGRLTLKQLGDGRIIMGGGWKAKGSLEDEYVAPDAENRAANIRYARATVPRLAEIKFDQALLGLEGRSPDSMPFFGPVADVPGFHMLACVHSGFVMAPLLADQLAELMVEGHTSFPMADYTCGEFLGQSESKVVGVF